MAVWVLGGEFIDEPALRIVIAGETFFATFLIATAVFALRVDADHLRKGASMEDEAIWVIILIVLGCICMSLAAIFNLLNGSAKHDGLHLGFSLVGVPLGWLTLHTVLAFHYAHLFYAPAAGRRKTAGGLEFPGTKEPTVWDFLYFSFTVGMTAQVSDVQVTDEQQRKLVLWHGIVSFFYNTGLLALAVNLVVQTSSN